MERLQDSHYGKIEFLYSACFVRKMMLVTLFLMLRLILTDKEKCHIYVTFLLISVMSEY